MSNFDAIIIGTGQSGPALARRLVAAGRTVAIIERKRFGGTCVNTGCTPTKTLIASAYAAHVARRAADYGVRIEGSVNIDMKAVKARKDAVVAASNNGVERSLKTLPGCTVYQGHGRFVAEKKVAVNNTELAADHIFLNVGARAAIPPIPGLDQVPYLTNSSIMDIDFLPTHLVILGGSYIGLEFAQMYRRFGSEVTVIELGPRLISREDADVSHTVADFLKDEGTNVRVDSKVVGAERQGNSIAVKIESGGKDYKRCWYARAGRDRSTAEHGRSWSRQSRHRYRRTWLYQGGRPVAHQRLGHLGDGRLQWPGGVHAHVVE
jgi:pyruvate/2-oxoglutarate dehydrogenase complex dihydrolipoamide dehydrogenase (E3) component